MGTADSLFYFSYNNWTLSYFNDEFFYWTRYAYPERERRYGYAIAVSQHLAQAKHGAAIMAAPHQKFANSRRLEQQFGRELQLPRWERTRD
jgi:hypothetical protein